MVNECKIGNYCGSKMASNYFVQFMEVFRLILLAKIIEKFFLFQLYEVVWC